MFIFWRCFLVRARGVSFRGSTVLTLTKMYRYNAMVEDSCARIFLPLVPLVQQVAQI